MKSWHLNIWQRGILGVGAILLLLAAAQSAYETNLDAALLPFLWGIVLAIVSVAPRVKRDLGE